MTKSKDNETMTKRGTPIRLELSDADLALIRSAAHQEGKPIFQFVTEATVARAMEILSKPRLVKSDRG
jgi:uncharacterized protein (DUF1778 family)